MKFDLRDQEIGRPAVILVTLNDTPQKDVIAFDTAADAVEVLVGGGLPVAFLGDREREQVGNYRGLATETLRGAVKVYRRIADQADLDVATKLKG